MSARNYLPADWDRLTLVTRSRGMGGWTIYDYLVEWTGFDYHGADDRTLAVCPTKEAAEAALRLMRL